MKNTQNDKTIIILGNFDAVNTSIESMILKKEKISIIKLFPKQLISQKYRLHQQGQNMVLIDLNSIENKIDTIRKLREANSNTIIIAMDQYQTEKLINPLINAGANGYLMNNTSEYEINNTINLMFYYKSEFKDHFQTENLA